MDIISVHWGDDTGGSGFNTATAFNRCRPEWSYHAYRGIPSYLNFPEHSPWNVEHITAAWLAADVVHLHDSYSNVIDRRPYVLTWHGTGFRENWDTYLTHRRRFPGSRELVSTLDLWLLAPDKVTWVPAAHDLLRYQEMANKARRKRTDAKIRIAHAPTAREMKQTDFFLEAAERLGKEVEVEVVLIEGKSWEECLQLKASCDILYDQVAFGYGGNAIEAWGMGMPVIAGGPGNVLAEYERRFGYIPFRVADRGSIYEALRSLVDPAARMFYGQMGSAHAQKYHSHRAVVDVLSPIYEEVAGP